MKKCNRFFCVSCNKSTIGLILGHISLLIISFLIPDGFFPMLTTWRNFNIKIIGLQILRIIWNTVGGRASYPSKLNILAARSKEARIQSRWWEETVRGGLSDKDWHVKTAAKHYRCVRVRFAWELMHANGRRSTSCTVQLVQWDQ